MKITHSKVVFYATLITSIALAIWGFFVPPKGVIDGSVLIVISIFLGFAMLAEIPALIKEGRSVKFTKGDMELSVGSDND